MIYYLLPMFLILFGVFIGGAIGYMIGRGYRKELEELEKLLGTFD